MIISVLSFIAAGLMAVGGSPLFAITLWLFAAIALLIWKYVGLFRAGFSFYEIYAKIRLFDHLVIPG